MRGVGAIPAERHTIRTRDGWRLAGYRHRPDTSVSRFGPVLLVHGLGTNRHDMDAPFPEISLAAYLHGRGHDVWVVELRGAGRSRPPGWPLRPKPQFDFDDYVHRDVPAIIRHILDRTGARSFHWVGHSMGGMLAYAALEHFDQALFRSVVTVGSPAFTAVKHPGVDQVYQLRPLLHVVRWVPWRRLGQVASLAPGLLHRLVGEIGANPDGMDPRHLRHLARRALSDLPAGLLEQFSEWYGGDGGFARTDGLLDYCDHLERIVAPMLIIAGAGDGLTPVADLRSVYESISSPERSFVVCGSDHGFRLDYGHIDLILGRHARDEVYPRIAAWLEAHA